ncbi:MAG: Ribosomal RNA large subunit methyltransferase L [Firmicutes bacterium ADurb.Bin182]|nr:MAG: Ribosomal RNA large subunit methyltransferase L [Firmicutes bacterium ADurb.Bin182]
MKFLVTCKLGLESVVARELKSLGIEPAGVNDARVLFPGDYSDMAKASVWLRCAERLLLVVGSFPAKSFDELFEGTKSLDWKRFLCRDAAIHVNGKSAKSALFSVSDCQSIVKKSIVENLKSAYNTAVIPETGSTIIVEVGLFKDTATLALDCSGAGLSRRGYRTYNVAAPLSETLGAALVLLSRHRPDQPLIDPMCGSGTIPIEAAMIAMNAAPGVNRKFAAEDWPFVEKQIWRIAREQARDSVREVKLDILGSDIDARSIELCKKHAKKAGVMLKWEVKPLCDIRSNKENGVIICNPPYGERMLEKREAENLYKQMRAPFEALDGWSVNVFTANRDFEKLYGRRADKRRKLSNGGMPCTLYQYFKHS